MGTIEAGANPDELDRLASIFGESADRIRSIQRAVNPQVNAAPWHGRNAEHFRHEWSTSHRRAIDDAVGFLEEGRLALYRHADEQRRVSGAGTAGTAPGVSRSSSVELDSGQIVGTGFDLLDIATGAAPTPFSFGVSIGLGLFDLVFDRDGYGGDYKAFESALDVLGIVAAGVGIAGLVVVGASATAGAVAGAAVAAPVAVAVVGAAAIAGGLIKAADMFFGTETGHRFLDAGADVIGDAWRLQAELLDAEWGSLAA